MLSPCLRDHGDLCERSCVFVGETDATLESFIALNRERVWAQPLVQAVCKFVQEEQRHLFDKVKDKKESRRLQFAK